MLALVLLPLLFVGVIARSIVCLLVLTSKNQLLELLDSSGATEEVDEKREGGLN